jgi:transposase
MPRRLLLLVVPLCLVLAAGGYWYLYGAPGFVQDRIARLVPRPTPAQAPTPPAQPPPEVGVIAARPAEVPVPVEYPGRVEGFRVVEVRARVGGLLLRREYEEGATVRADQVLFRIDPVTYQVALDRAQARRRRPCGRRSRTMPASANSPAGRSRELGRVDEPEPEAGSGQLGDAAGVLADGVDGPRHRCAEFGSCKPEEEPSAMTISVIGLDTAKTVFQVHGVDESGRVALKRQLRRGELIPFFEQQPRCTVILEACGAGHHWARLLSGLGHEVKLIAPEAVRPFVKKGKKNDAADAAALCVAGSRPEMRFVPIKSVEQQAVLALHTVRSLLVKQQTMLANALRGLAAEFGLTTPKGMGKLAELIALVSTDESLPAAGRRAMAELYAHGRVVADRLAALEAKITSHARHDETARRLATIPGIGPITASLIAATVGDNIGAFRSARHFAAWLGLVPRQHSTGGKVRLGRITKAGNAEIRKLLVLGATSMVRRATLWNSKAGLWVQGVLARRPVRLVTVALANKMARIAWALITRKQVYQAQGHALTAAEAAA